jgi:hypothetical protein
LFPYTEAKKILKRCARAGVLRTTAPSTRPFIPSTLTGVADRKQTTCSTRSGPTDACQPGVVAHEPAALLGRDLNKPEVHDLGAEAVAALKAESAL